MASLVMFPSSSLPPFYSLNSSTSPTSTAQMPSSPSSPWSPSTSPLAQIHSTHSPSTSTSTASSSLSPSAVVAVSLSAKSLVPSSSPRPLLASAYPTTATVAYSLVSHSQASPVSPPQCSTTATVVTSSPSHPSSTRLLHSPAHLLLPSNAPTGGSAPPQHSQPQQTFLVNQMGQTFILSPVAPFSHHSHPSTLQSSLVQASTQAPLQQLLPHSHLSHSSSAPSASQQVWLSGGDVMAWNGAPVQLMSGQFLQVNGPPSQSQSHPFQASPLMFVGHPNGGGGGGGYSTMGGSSLAVCTSAGPSLVQGVPAAPTSSLSPLSPSPALLQSPVTVALPAFSAFHTPSRRSDSSSSPALVVAATPPVPQPPQTNLPNSTKSHPQVARRRPSSSSASSSSSSSSSSSTCSSPRLSMDEVDAVSALSASTFVPTTSMSRRRFVDEDSQAAPQRIDGMSSSRLLTHISKKPSYVLPFTVHRSQLPGHFENSPASSSPSSIASSSPSSDSSGTVTVNIRVMGGPSVSDLFFVAADLSQLIHSRKSNIAKAVSVFSDSERARCSVICPRSNQTQSTHILTVLTMDGVRRLLQSSRAAIALPFLAWINQQVQDIVSQTGKAGKRRGDRDLPQEGVEESEAPSHRGQEQEGKAKKARKE